VKVDKNDIFDVMLKDDLEGYKKLEEKDLALDTKIAGLGNWPSGADLLDLALYANPEKKIASYLVENDDALTFGNAIFKKLNKGGNSIVPLVIEKGYDARCEEAQVLLSELLGISGNSSQMDEYLYESVHALVAAGTPTEKFLGDTGLQSNLADFVTGAHFKHYAELLESVDVDFSKIKINGEPLAHHLTHHILACMAQERMHYGETGEEYEGTENMMHTRKHIAKLLTRWRDLGVGFNVLDADGDAPLHRVLKNKQYQEPGDLDYAIRALVALDADPYTPNSQGLTALDIASDGEMDGVMQALNEHKVRSSTLRP
jgi:hypothetical protein